MSSTVDILPIEEMTSAVILIRKVTVKSLRHLSIALEFLADSLEVPIEEPSYCEEEIIQEEVIQSSNGIFSSPAPSSSLRPRTISEQSSDSGVAEDDLETDPETGLEVISLYETGLHNSEDDGWIILYDRVYDITDYLLDRKHPGGQELLLEYLGYDATLAFRGVGHSKAAARSLEKYLVGILPKDERLNFSSDF